MQARVARFSRKGSIAVTFAEGCGLQWTGVAATRIGPWERSPRSRMQTIAFARFRLSTSTSSLSASARFFLRREISYGLIVVCVLFHDYDSPRKYPPGAADVDNLAAMLCFTFVVYFIQRYIEQREGSCQNSSAAA